MISAMMSLSPDGKGPGSGAGSSGCWVGLVRFLMMLVVVRLMGVNNKMAPSCQARGRRGAALQGPELK